jgi:5-methylcytosine-specific restriction protein B
VTPHNDARIDDPKRWFLEVVRTEIGPLLEEYWFDAVDKAHEARERLGEGL